MDAERLARPDEGGPRRSWSFLSITTLGLLAVTLVVFAYFAWQKRWMGDDGFINLRIVRNILQGHGFVFNVGERVEASTSPMWIFVLTILGGIGITLERAAVYFGILLSLGAIVLASLGAMALERRGRVPGIFAGGLFLPLGAFTYAVVPSAWEYASSGLETGLSIFWLAGSFWITVMLANEEDEPQLKRWLPAGSWLGLGPLVRPELALFSAAWFILTGPALFVRSSDKRALRVFLLFAAFGALPVAYEIFRMGYFACIVPNTALAKSAFDSRWDQGFHYFNNFFTRYYLLLPLGLVLALTAARVQDLANRAQWMRIGAVLVPTMVGLAYVVYVVKVGGGFMHGRLFLPGFFAITIPVSVIPVRARLVRIAGFALVVLWGSICAAYIRHPVENEYGIGDERGWYSRMADNPNPILLDGYSEFMFYHDGTNILSHGVDRCPGGNMPMQGETDHGCERFVLLDVNVYGMLQNQQMHYPLNPDATEDEIVFVAMRTAMGIIGYQLGPNVHLVDHVGLSDPIASRLALNHRGRPGHEKSLSAYWLVGRFSAPHDNEDPRVTAAREATQCGELQELLDSIRGPITAGQFVDNIGNSLRFHRLDVPDDPFEARDTFCGTDS